MLNAKRAPLFFPLLSGLRSDLEFIKIILALNIYAPTLHYVDENSQKLLNIEKQARKFVSTQDRYN